MNAVTSVPQHPNGNGLPPVASIPLSDDQAAGTGGQSLGALVKEATVHVSALIRAELELARAEITAEVKKGLTGSVLFLIALTMALLAMPFALTAAALGIDKGLWSWADPWGGFLIVFLAMLLIAGLCAYLGFKKVRKIRAPQRTISTVRDTAAALKRSGEPEHPNGF
ncbi:MAG TPA: phage holin family protein [Pseudonocardiaceae bacterium]|jgi:cytochrome c biogenesis factor|nr:phage holin family protein [Pseudonocardiaceae bacterium]